MDVETAKARRIKHRLRQDHAISDDDRGVGVKACKFGAHCILFEAFRRQHAQAVAQGERMNGGGRFLPAAPGGLGRV